MTFVAGGALKPIGGHILSHSSATRMFLRKGELTDTPTNVIFKASCKPMSLVRSGGIIVDGISLPPSLTQDVPKNEQPNLLIARTDQKAKRRTSWMKEAGLTFDDQLYLGRVLLSVDWSGSCQWYLPIFVPYCLVIGSDFCCTITESGRAFVLGVTSPTIPHACIMQSL